MPSFLEQYRITDFLDWHKEKRLELNPNFQRGAVWTPAARTFLIDTILRQLPIPKVYLRTRVDIASKQSIREVVDGQQRLRAIIEFADDRFALSKRAGEFSGKKYSSLEPELQERFLSYAIAVDQLLNASDDDVLEVFSRLNSYSVALNAAEKRHAKFQGDFKWIVRATSRAWASFWEKHGVLTVRERVRMLDDSLVAEMFGILLEGVRDGGQAKIDGIYRRHDATFAENASVIERFETAMTFIEQYLADALTGTAILRPAHFLMLFAAVACAQGQIPQGELQGVPASPEGALSDPTAAADNLRFLASIIESDEIPEAHEDFWRASTATTQRIASRRIRLPLYLRALGPEPVG